MLVVRLMGERTGEDTCAYVFISGGAKKRGW
jgi:hypothetical protein